MKDSDGDTNKATLAAYETGVAEYNAAAIPSVEGSVKSWLDAALAMLSANALILELGSAHGRDATYIASKGFTIEPTDAVQAFVDYMRQHDQDARLLNALTDDYGGPYDMVYANAVLLHFTPEQVVQVLARIRTALRPSGIFVFSVKVGEGMAWSDAKLKSPRFFTYWHEKPLKELLVSAGFEIAFWEEGQTGHDNGNWYHVIARRTKS